MGHAILCQTYGDTNSLYLETFRDMHIRFGSLIVEFRTKLVTIVTSHVGVGTKNGTQYLQTKIANSEAEGDLSFSPNFVRLLGYLKLFRRMDKRSVLE